MSRAAEMKTENTSAVTASLRLECVPKRNREIFTPLYQYRGTSFETAQFKVDYFLIRSGDLAAHGAQLLFHLADFADNRVQRNFSCGH
jgi:hypothetical protein